MITEVMKGMKIDELNIEFTKFENRESDKNDFWESIIFSIRK